MKSIIKVPLFLLTMCLVSVSFSALSAFCSLRDPISAVNYFYPEGYKYRSIMASITEETRKQVQNILPFTLHRSEVGQHTLYLVVNKHLPQGFVQARSELTQWGIIELAWQMSLDIEIENVYFQRCRSPKCNESLAKAFSKQLKNKNIKELLLLLSPDGDKLITDFSSDPDINVLWLLTIKSGLKTLVVTQTAWANDIHGLSTKG
jgi:hypothetical protein